VTRFGEFSPNWLVPYFGSFLKITEVAQKFSATNYVLILTRHGLGCILGDFFSTNLSGSLLWKVFLKITEVAQKFSAKKPMY
jgi:hypothetical protein